MAALEAINGDVAKIAEGLGAVQLPVLAKDFDVVGALHLVQCDFLIIRPGDRIAARIEIETPRVSAALGEELEFFRAHVVAPDSLLKGDAVDRRFHRAALRAIKPAIGSKL